MITVLDSIWNKLILQRKKVMYGSNLKLNGRIRIHGVNNRIKIGNNCIITSDPDYNSTAGSGRAFFTVLHDGKINIGNNVGMSLVSITSFESITIEDNVLIGANTKIWDTDFHPIDYLGRRNHEKSKTAPVHIKEGAFIGACSIVLKGVTIGKHSVIGAGSVVTHDVPDNEIWAGNPAKFVRRIED